MKVVFSLPNIGPIATTESVTTIAHRAEPLGYMSLWAIERWHSRLLRPCHVSWSVRIMDAEKGPISARAAQLPVEQKYNSKISLSDTSKDMGQHWTDGNQLRHFGGGGLYGLQRIPLTFHGG